MVCEHLKELEIEVMAAGVRETFRGNPWSDGCREWVYFDCFFDLASLRKRLRFAASVQDYLHLGTHDGQECGFVCTVCADGIMGVHERCSAGMRVYS
jgi:hypothetical protein